MPSQIIQFTTFLLLCFAKTAFSIEARIVSVAVPSDEILSELLEKCGKKSDLVAVSVLAADARYAEIAPWALRLDRASDSFEKILALKPTLVVASSFNRHQLREFLQKQKFKSYILESFTSVEDILSHIETLGRLTGCTKDANDMTASFRSTLASLKQQALALNSINKILYYASQGYTSGKNTPQDSLAQKIGLRNIAGQLNGWSKISAENLLVDEPDFIVITNPELQKEVESSSGLKKLRAVKSRAFIHIPGKYLDSLSQTLVKSGSEMIDQALKLKKGQQKK